MLLLGTALQGKADVPLLSGPGSMAGRCCSEPAQPIPSPQEAEVGLVLRHHLLPAACGPHQLSALCPARAWTGSLYAELVPALLSSRRAPHAAKRERASLLLTTCSHAPRTAL